MTVLSRKVFAEFLRRLANDIETGDSLEGSVSYTFDREKYDHVEVEAAVRCNNLQGQGGMVLL